MFLKTVATADGNLLLVSHGAGAFSLDGLLASRIMEQYDG